MKLIKGVIPPGMEMDHLCRNNSAATRVISKW